MSVLSLNNMHGKVTFITARYAYRNYRTLLDYVRWLTEAGRKAKAVYM